MKAILLDNYDWIGLRQALSLSLLTCKQITFSDFAIFIERNNRFLPILKDIEHMISVVGCGHITRTGGSMMFQPLPVTPGSYNIKTGSFSSIVDLALFAMPALFMGKFRTILDCEGVTHAGAAVSPLFLKETMLSMLEHAGLYGSWHLKRFGFYGSGGGRVEIRMYPSEHKEGRIPVFFHQCSIVSARIYIAGVSMDIGMRVKKMLGNSLHLPEEKIGILEILDADGMGCSVLLIMDCNGIPVVFSREAAVYNDAGDFVFDENELAAAIEELAVEAHGVAGSCVLPGYLMRELVPYCFMTGTGIDQFQDDPLVRKTADMCRLFFS